MAGLLCYPATQPSQAARGGR